MTQRDNGEIGKSGPIVLYCDYFGKGLLEESSRRDQEAAEGQAFNLQREISRQAETPRSSMAGEDSQAVDAKESRAQARVQEPFQHSDQKDLHSKRCRVPRRGSAGWSSRRVPVSSRSLSDVIQRTTLDNENVLRVRDA